MGISRRTSSGQILRNPLGLCQSLAGIGNLFSCRTTDGTAWGTHAAGGKSYSLVEIDFVTGELRRGTEGLEEESGIISPSLSIGICSCMVWNQDQRTLPGFSQPCKNSLPLQLSPSYTLGKFSVSRAVAGTANQKTWTLQDHRSCQASGRTETGA